MKKRGQLKPIGKEEENRGEKSGFIIQKTRDSNDGGKGEKNVIQ